MNFFKLYIGDYQRDTGTLTLAQHGAYNLMLQFYCATEKPLPTGAELYHLLRASSKAERDAVDIVVARYWRRDGDGLVNDRALEEIQIASKKRSANQENGKQGGRPRKSENKPNGNPLGSFSEPKQNLIQTPDSREDSERDKSLSAQTPLEPDPRRQLFTLGKSILGESSGGLISKAIARTSEARVASVLGEMAVRPTADPRAYFAAATKPETPEMRGFVA